MLKNKKRIIISGFLVGLFILFFIDKDENAKIIVSHSVDIPLMDVDFNESNGIELVEKYALSLELPFDVSDLKLNLLRKNYERLKPSIMAHHESPIIPKVIHFIWLGDERMPKNYEYYVEIWKKFHPNWQIKIWHEEDFKKENFSNYDLYSKAETYAERADIMRYEILNRYGGLYVDTDIECFANFDEFHHKYDFYVNLEPPVITKGNIQIVNSMIGSVPNHPILVSALDKIRNEWNNNSALFFNNFANYPLKMARSKHHLAVRRTMLPFSDVIFEYLVKQDYSISKSIVLPIGYNIPLYPISDNYTYKFIMRPETRSIHHYDKSNSLLEDLTFSKTLFDFDIITNSNVAILNSQNHLYLDLLDLYKDHFPTKVTYNLNPQIPQNIYIFNNEKIDETSMVELKLKWQKLNPFAIITILKEQDLISYIPEKIKNANPDILAQIARFYFLNKNGGVFVDINFKPMRLQEFNYKYKFYGQLNTIFAPEDPLDISINFIASKKNHVIIENVIEDIEKSLLLGHKVTLEIIKETYLNSVCKYNRIDGKNIVFPEKLFEQKR